MGVLHPLGARTAFVCFIVLTGVTRVLRPVVTNYGNFVCIINNCLFLEADSPALTGLLSPVL